MNVEDLLCRAEWGAALLGAIAEQLPVDGTISGPDGLVHGILGNFTACDIVWCRTGRDDDNELHVQVHEGWLVVCVAATCLKCVCDLMERG